MQALGNTGMSNISHLSLRSPGLLFLQLPLLLCAHLPCSLRSLFSLGSFILLLLLLIYLYRNVIWKKQKQQKKVTKTHNIEWEIVYMKGVLERKMYQSRQRLAVHVSVPPSCQGLGDGAAFLPHDPLPYEAVLQPVQWHSDGLHGQLLRDKREDYVNYIHIT